MEYIPSQRATQRCHYYSKKSDPLCTYGVWHPLAAEKLIALAMNTATDNAVFYDGYISIPGYSKLSCWQQIIKTIKFLFNSFNLRKNQTVRIEINRCGSNEREKFSGKKFVQKLTSFYYLLNFGSFWRAVSFFDMQYFWIF